MGFSVRLWFLYECFEMVLFRIETYRSVVNLSSIVVYCLLNPNHIMCSFDVNLRVIVMKRVLAAPSKLQVWSQTQLYSVGFRQSRIIVKIVILQNTLARSTSFSYILVPVIDSFLEPLRLKQHNWWCILVERLVSLKIPSIFFRDRDKGELLQKTKDKR